MFPLGFSINSGWEIGESTYFFLALCALMNVSIAQGGNSGQAGRTMNEELQGTADLHAVPMRHLHSAPAGA